LSVAAVLASDPPPEATTSALAAFLGARLGANVDPESIAWEPPRNMLVELAVGRRALFLASPPNGGPRDVYRASVRLTPSGQPLAISSLENLTDTPDADELGLVVEGDLATFATTAEGSVRAVTALEVGRSRPERTDILLDVPVREATLARETSSLTVRLDTHAEPVRYDLARRSLASPEGVARATRHAARSRGATLAFADGARGLLGEAVTNTLASLGRWLRDAAERAVYAVVHVGRRPEPRATPVKARITEAKSARRAEEVWPPPKVPSLFLRAEPDEGTYRALVTRGAEPCVYRTFVRPDPERPYARAVVVAMDMRQLELGLVAGGDVPRPSAGPPGDGRLAGDVAELRRIVAVFSGGRALGDRFGMRAGGRLLAPPAPGAVSVTALAQGEALVGPWSFGASVPSEVVAFRQGLDALLDAKGELLDGDARSARDVRPRSGLCATPAGHLHYAFGERLDRRALATALARSGCAFAVELAGGAEPAGLAIGNVTARGAGHFIAVDSAMTFDAEGTLEGSSRDFFTVSLRDLMPSLPKGAPWRPAPGMQPSPAWATGIFHASIPLGGLTVELFSFENGRVEWKLRPGRREPGAKGEAWAGFLPEGDAERALAALELGHTTVTPRLGLALGTNAHITLKDSFATLLLEPTEVPRILAPGEAVKLVADGQAVQLPLLADAGGITERARDRGDLRMRAALGVTRSGRVLVALLRHDSSDPLAVALKDAGAERVVELDRGSHHPAFFDRAGTPTPPTPTYESTTLWALGRPMLPGARVTRDDSH
jgi:hypothetical protein